MKDEVRFDWDGLMQDNPNLLIDYASASLEKKIFSYLNSILSGISIP